MARKMNHCELTDQMFNAYHTILCESFCVQYADFILGKPKEVKVPKFPLEKIHTSFEKCECIQCAEAIPEQTRFDHSYEIIKGGDAHPFYLCGGCQ